MRLVAVLVALYAALYAGTPRAGAWLETYLLQNQEKKPLLTSESADPGLLKSLRVIGKYSGNSNDNIEDLFSFKLYPHRPGNLQSEKRILAANRSYLRYRFDRAAAESLLYRYDLLSEATSRLRLLELYARAQQLLKKRIAVLQNPANDEIDIDAFYSATEAIRMLEIEHSAESRMLAHLLDTMHRLTPNYPVDAIRQELASNPLPRVEDVAAFLATLSLPEDADDIASAHRIAVAREKLDLARSEEQVHIESLKFGYDRDESYNVALSVNVPIPGSNALEIEQRRLELQSARAQQRSEAEEKRAELNALRNTLAVLCERYMALEKLLENDAFASAYAKLPSPDPALLLKIYEKQNGKRRALVEQRRKIDKTFTKLLKLLHRIRPDTDLYRLLSKQGV